MAKKKKNIVWLQSWEESEAGWGVRPDGFSLHLTEKGAKKYSKDFLTRQEEQLGPVTPHEYDRPAGEPYQVSVDDKTLEEIRKKGHLRVCSNKNMPEPLVVAERTGWYQD